MKLVACDIRKLGGVKSFYKKSANLILLEEFVNSNMNCARVDDFPQCDAKSCSSSLNASIRRYKMNGIEAHCVRNHVYLIKKSKYRQENT